MASHKRINKKTPNGGDYSEIYFMNDNRDIIDETEATRCAIRECKNDGTLISETWGTLEKDK